MDRTSASGAGSLGSSPDGSAILQDLSVKNVISLKKNVCGFCEILQHGKLLKLVQRTTVLDFVPHFMYTIGYVIRDMLCWLGDL